MVNVSRSNMYIVKRRGSLCAESEREGTAKKEHSLEKCGRSVAESVAATKVWQPQKCGSHNNGGNETRLPHFLWHATLATPFPELVGTDRLRSGNVVSGLGYFQE